MRTEVTFNGVDLTALGFVGDYRGQLLPREIYREQVPDRDGDVFLGARYTSRTITLTLTVHDRDITARQQAARALAAALAVDEPKPLVLSIDDGLYHLALPVSASDDTRYANHTSYDVDFEILDPAAYGETKTVIVPENGSLTFTVGGTYPTMPIVMSGAKNPSGGKWKLTLDSGDYLMADVPTAKAVEFDCSARTFKVSSAVRVLPLDCDWLVLDPGPHTLSVTGYGQARVTFTERWL